MIFLLRFLRNKILTCPFDPIPKETIKEFAGTYTAWARDECPTPHTGKISHGIKYYIEMNYSCILYTSLSSDALLSAPADALPVDVFPAELPQPARQLTASAAVKNILTAFFIIASIPAHFSGHHKFVFKHKSCV